MPAPKPSPILCLDFDGVVHSYVSGWKGARNIPDPPVPGALQFIREALDAGYDVVIHSSRARYFGGIWAMRRWLQKHAEAANLWDRESFDPFSASLFAVRFTRWKPPAVVTLDDRGVRFDGTFPSPKALMEMKPWNKP